jgi:aspartyl-tRNA(Asn)/glutamyl-tRNA(Gln) amidotransferase subunit C
MAVGRWRMADQIHPGMYLPGLTAEALRRRCRRTDLIVVHLRPSAIGHSAIEHRTSNIAHFLYICPMEINDSMVDKLAKLAKLRFDDNEKIEIKTDLQRMISFVEKLNELNLEGVQPLLHMSEETNVLREDEIKGSVSRDKALQNAPLHDEQFFKVPKVIRK